MYVYVYTCTYVQGRVARLKAVCMCVYYNYIFIMFQLTVNSSLRGSWDTEGVSDWQFCRLWLDISVHYHTPPQVPLDGMGHYVV